MAKTMSAQFPVKPTVNDLAATATAAMKERGPAPVHLWNPPFCGNIDMRIAKDGTWFHEGGPITRPAMVKLFSSILRKEGDAYFLVTPVEKVGITVEDAPFVAQNMEVEGSGDTQVLRFETHIGESATAGPENPIRVEIRNGEPAPYVTVRADLEAKIDRKTFYRMVDVAEEQDIDGTAWFGVRSSGVFFPMIPAADLA
ncbi:hypothetical protein BXY66_3267 [Shimia isoporae]|uniref:Proteophosphoglycan n=1 Tax=Shimia isoporae TaxID=647720 RepID=A0A4R1N2K0_9RHOB|nr:DUF1285 domain-containing protein [Shimia isoporae]TCL00620.1 hypothetical protein BXY66_3267 [Shimia isoporae]